MSDMIDDLLCRKVNFLADDEAGDIALCSRIRLARNLNGFCFPAAEDREQLEAVRNIVREKITGKTEQGKEFLAFFPEELNDIEQEILFERRLVSREFLCRTHSTALFCNTAGGSSVMVNEEDHIRIQTLKPGFSLPEAWQSASALDCELGRELDYAFDGKLGFLTCCPTNVGTGMRASVMLHLPGLVLSGQISAAIQGINKLNLAVRGIFGEGTENLGNLFQVSNQSTLGESEQQIMERLSAVIAQMISHEKNARCMLWEKDRYSLMDNIGRSYGLLRHACKLTSKEAVNSLSGIRLGVDLGMFSGVDLAAVNELFINTNPAHLQKFANRRLNQQERDIHRAALVREKLGGNSRQK